MTAVADASPLIALQQVGQLELLRALFAQITMPPAVAREVRPTVPGASWIVERALSQPIPPLAQRATLAAGEREALTSWVRASGWRRASSSKRSLQRARREPDNLRGWHSPPA